MSSKDNLALDLEHGVRRWDRQRWISVFSSHNPTIREVTECLGLGLSASSSTTNRGIPKFDNPDYRKLSSEVTKLSKELPKERDALLDFAADPQSLDTELEELLGTDLPTHTRPNQKDLYKRFILRGARTQKDVSLTMMLLVLHLTASYAKPGLVSRSTCIDGSSSKPVITLET
jgi:hypothetical protein